VTLLFADLRAFTSLASSLSHEEVYELLGHVMDCLTADVMEHDGVVIDYYGDGLAAMWNAPVDQSDHAERACRAAMAMIDLLPDIAADWAGILDSAKIRLGVGVHTGVVHVGNAGSRQRTKYGPRGANVHLASRVEAATKPLGLPLVITNPTAARLPENFSTYRICRAELPGIDEPVDLYGIRSHTTDSHQSPAIDAYGRALRLFEQDKLRQAADVLANVDSADEPVPIRFLAEHIQRELNRQRRRKAYRGDSRRRGIIALNDK